MPSKHLYQVCGLPGIRSFEPQTKAPGDLAGGDGFVWAVDEHALPNYLLPAGCPRVTFRIGTNTTIDDVERFIDSPRCPHVVAIEHRWLPALTRASLWLYELDPADFRVRDANAGFYVSRTREEPLSVNAVGDLPAELAARGVELRIVDNLWFLAEKIRETSFVWSLCCMFAAQPANY